MAARAELRPADAATALGLTRSGVCRALGREAPAALVRAVERQLVLRAARPLSAAATDFGVEPARPKWRRSG